MKFTRCITIKIQNTMDIKELSNNAQIQVVLNIADLKELFLEWKEDNLNSATL